MDLTLDYHIELYPLKKGDNISVALATSLLRPTEGGSGNGADGNEEEKDTYVWRPDGKGQRGIDEDYEYVMYGKVCIYYKIQTQHRLRQILRCINLMAALHLK